MEIWWEETCHAGTRLVWGGLVGDTYLPPFLGNILFLSAHSNLARTHLSIRNSCRMCLVYQASAWGLVDYTPPNRLSEKMWKCLIMDLGFYLFFARLAAGFCGWQCLFDCFNQCFGFQTYVFQRLAFTVLSARSESWKVNKQICWPSKVLSLHISLLTNVSFSHLLPFRS